MESLSPSNFFETETLPQLGGQLLADNRPLAGPSQSDVDELMRKYAVDTTQQASRPFGSENDFPFETMLGHAGGAMSSFNAFSDNVKSSPMDDDILKRYLASPLESGASPSQPDTIPQVTGHTKLRGDTSRTAPYSNDNRQDQSSPSGQERSRSIAALSQNATASQRDSTGATADASALLGAINALGDAGKQQLLAILSLAVNDNSNPQNASIHAIPASNVNNGNGSKAPPSKRSSERSQTHRNSASLVKQSRHTGLMADSPGSASGGSVTSASASGSTGTSESNQNIGTGTGNGNATAVYFANAFSQFRPPSRDSVQASASALRHGSKQPESHVKQIKRSDSGAPAEKSTKADKLRAGFAVTSPARRSAPHVSYPTSSQQSSPLNTHSDSQKTTEMAGFDVTQLYRSPAIGTSSTAFYTESLGDDQDILFTPLMSPALTMSTQPGPSIGPLPESFANLGKDGFAHQSALKSAFDQFNVIHHLSPLTSPALAPVPEHSTTNGSTFSRPASISSGRSHRGASKNVPKARPSPILRPVQNAGTAAGSQYSSPAMSPIGRTDRTSVGRGSGRHSRSGSTSSLHATSMLLPPPAAGTAPLARDQTSMPHSTAPQASTAHTRQPSHIAFSAPTSPVHQPIGSQPHHDSRYTNNLPIWQDSPSPQQLDLTSLTPAALTLLQNIHAARSDTAVESSLASSANAIPAIQASDAITAQTASPVSGYLQQQQAGTTSGSAVATNANSSVGHGWLKQFDNNLDYDAILTMLGTNCLLPATQVNTSAALSDPLSRGIPQDVNAYISGMHYSAIHTGGTQINQRPHSASGHQENVPSVHLPVSHRSLSAFDNPQMQQQKSVRPNDIAPPMTPSSFMNMPLKPSSNLSAMPFIPSSLHGHSEDLVLHHIGPSDAFSGTSGNWHQAKGPVRNSANASTAVIPTEAVSSQSEAAAVTDHETTNSKSMDALPIENLQTTKSKSMTRKRSLSTTGKKAQSAPKRAPKKSAATSTDVLAIAKQKQETTQSSSANVSPNILPDNRKSSHKIAEQRRRDSLKNCFEELRFILPPINPEEDEDFNNGNKRPGENNVGGQRSKGGMIDPRHPNKGISKVALLRKSNEYVSKLHERIDRRDAIIEVLRGELRQCRIALKQADEDDVEAQDALSAVDWDQVAADTDVQPPPYRLYSTTNYSHKLQYATANGIIHEEDETLADQGGAGSAMDLDGDVGIQDEDLDQSDLDVSGDYRSKRSKRKNSTTSIVNRQVGSVR